MGSQTEKVEGFCHNPECDEFGVVQKLTVSNTHPSNWIDDPECRRCLGKLEQQRPDMTDWVPPGWDEDLGVDI